MPPYFPPSVENPLNLPAFESCLASLRSLLHLRSPLCLSMIHKEERNENVHAWIILAKRICIHKYRIFNSFHIILYASVPPRFESLTVRRIRSLWRKYRWLRVRAWMAAANIGVNILFIYYFDGSGKKGEPIQRPGRAANIQWIRLVFIRFVLFCWCTTFVVVNGVGCERCPDTHTHTQFMLISEIIININCNVSHAHIHIYPVDWCEIKCF